MKSNSVEILLLSDYGLLATPGTLQQKFEMNWFAKKLFPLIQMQEAVIKKVILKSMTNTPAIYLS